MAIFIAGVKHRSLMHGSGWTNCPSCGDYTAHDVIDDMGYIAVAFYRLTPISRRRYLKCCRCGERRVAETEALASLQTVGKRLHRSWFVPSGLLGIAAVVGLIIGVMYISQSQNAAAIASSSLSFTPQTGDVIAPVTFRGPSNWSYAPTADAIPPQLNVSEGDGAHHFVLRRFSQDGVPMELMTTHFQDEKGLGTSNFPDTAPPPTTTKIAGLDALTIKLDYQVLGENSEMIMYTFAHDGVGYTLTFIATGNEAIKTNSAIAQVVINSWHFVAPETPSLPTENMTP